MEQMLFGQILLNFHMVEEEDLKRCLKIQRYQGSNAKPLGAILVEQGLLDERILSTILTVQE